MSGRDDAVALYRQAQSSCREGRLAEGVALAREALTVAPQEARIHVLLGMALARLGEPNEALASFDRAIACDGSSADAHGNRGDVLTELGRLAEAEQCYRSALALAPDSVANWCNLGAVQSDLGQLAPALASYDRVVALAPAFAQAHFNRANVLALMGRDRDAIEAFDTALRLNPDYPDALNNRGQALRRLGQPENALASFARALAIAPDHRDALISQGDALRSLGRHQEAIESYERVLAVQPAHREALMGCGSALIELKRHADALAAFERLVAADPDDADAWNNRGFVLNLLARRDEALASCERALSVDPRHTGAFNNRGVVLAEQGLSEQAIASYDQAVAIDPRYVAALCNRAKALGVLRRHDAALADAKRAVAVDPHHPGALFVLGSCLSELDRDQEAIACFEQLLAIDPDHPRAEAALAHACLDICDWRRASDVGARLHKRIAEGSALAAPFTLLGYPFSPADLLACTKAFVAHELPPVPILPPLIVRRPAERIRLAYLSADFHRHATAYLMARLFELHDRSRFEVIGISFGRDDGSDMRVRLARAFDRFHDVASRSNDAIARLLREAGVDIAVDLKGHTEGARPGILASRPAPVQVNYLGYPSTMGMDCIDYVIADPIVLPHDQQPFYVEKIVHLPECYQANDDRRPIAPRVRLRREEGLPEQGLVFCCFNNNWKLNAPIFDVWMRILAAVDGSVLWLLRTNDPVADNLRREARARGVDPARLVFAPFRDLPDHLARFGHADVFLDTLPYNAHTTASDALWAGVPVLTCRGETFAGRVAASLLYAIGLPELVTDDLAAYEALALRLASDPELRSSLRARLVRNRLTHPLFNTDRFRRHIEAAYETMLEIHRRGEAPRAFSVEAVGD